MKKTISLITICFAIAFTSLAYSANYYIRDGASGETCADWGDNACNTLPSTLERGSTYYIADGTYDSYTFDDAVSGTSLITIKKATASDHGTETGWQSSYGDGTATFSPITFSTNYWVFDGVTGGGPGNWKTGFGFEVTPASNNSDCITLSGALDSVTITHVDAHVYPADTPRESMTNYHYQILKGTTGACSNITISHCYFHNTFGCMLQLASQWTGPLTVEYSYFAQNRNTPEQHSAGIACHGANNVTVRYNIWEDIDGTAVIDGIETGSMDYWYVYGNVFVYTGNYGVSLSGVILCAYDECNEITSSHWRVYNNSIINIKGYAQMGWADPDGTDIIIQNNLFYGNRTDDSYVNYVYYAGYDISSDYNWYSATAHPGGFLQGAHENAIIEGPNCKLSVDTTDYFVDWENGNYQLKLPTDTGNTLSSPYNIDLMGVTRGGDGVWDRGAYEYISKPGTVSFRAPQAGDGSMQRATGGTGSITY